MVTFLLRRGTTLNEENQLKEHLAGAWKLFKDALIDAWSEGKYLVKKKSLFIRRK